jgi:hypothetical protein
MFSSGAIFCLTDTSKEYNIILNGVSQKQPYMTEQEKLDILIRDFRQLEENRKDYIRELIRKLVVIHCKGEFENIAYQKSNISLPNIHYKQGVLV